ncbi:hypothetical protein KFL_004070080 [Klebsormidium nitens]|uniref:Uncharacterized protein n=1 Tax=Klebsormidium nitens TaxID=105231 RepID=A0A1Y1IHH2_KLENI|nr:hypothetical protein KFL_004070080 [Klebsormidium nitens]|eukprot:GAQ88186.1 hypothetical protein KFL_004070080 [Klebsormidium nitens]
MSQVDILQLSESHQDFSNFDPEHRFEDAFSPAETRQVQVLLWDHVKTLLQEAEQEEVKRALGAAAIEENEQLFREAASLEEILGDLQRGGEKQAEVQRLFETPARSLVEDEIRLLLEALHRSSSEDVPNTQFDNRFPEPLPDEPQESDNLDSPESPSESFYFVKAPTPQASKSASIGTQHSLPTDRSSPTASNNFPTTYAHLPAAYSSLPSRRDCHSAPIPVQNAKDKQIFEYLTARPASSGSVRPRTSDGRSLLRPGTAHLPRPETSGGVLLNPLPRPQTAAVRYFPDDCGRFLTGQSLDSPVWERPSSATSYGGASSRNSRADPIESPRCSVRATETNGPASSSGLNQRGVESGGSSRPGSQRGRALSRSSDGSDRKADGSDRGVGSRPGTGSSLGGHQSRQIVEAVADRLNVFEVGAVAAPLQRALADERAALLEDIECLHQLIDEEAESHHKVLWTATVGLKNFLRIAVSASRPPPSIKDLRDYGARLEASLRAHIVEANLTRERASPARTSKQIASEARNGRTGESRLASPRKVAEQHSAGGWEAGTRTDGPRGDGISKEEGVRRNGVDRHMTANCAGVDSHKGELQRSNGCGRTQQSEKKSNALKHVTTIKVDRLEQLPVSVGDEDASGERWSPSMKRTSSSKVRKFRSFVMDLQTEASGAASLCRAEIT